MDRKITIGFAFLFLGFQIKYIEFDEYVCRGFKILPIYYELLKYENKREIGGGTSMILQEFMELDIYKSADIIKYVNKNGEEMEEDEADLLSSDLISHHKGSCLGTLEIELNME